MLFGNVIFIKKTGLDGSKFPVTERAIKFGRGEECGIRIENPHVSQQQCELIVEANGQAKLRNLCPTNPTILNKKPLGSGDHSLRHGDIVQIGERLARWEYLSSSPYHTASPSQAASKLVAIVTPQRPSSFVSSTAAEDAETLKRRAKTHEEASFAKQRKTIGGAMLEHQPNLARVLTGRRSLQATKMLFSPHKKASRKSMPGKPKTPKTPRTSPPKSAVARKSTPMKTPTPRRVSAVEKLIKSGAGRSTAKAPSLKTIQEASPARQRHQPTPASSPALFATPQQTPAKITAKKRSPVKVGSPESSSSSFATPRTSPSRKTSSRSPSPKKTPKKTPGGKSAKKAALKRSPSPAKLSPSALKTPGGKSAKKSALKRSPSPAKSSPAVLKTPGKSAKKATLKTPTAKGSISPGRTSSVSKKTPGKSAKKAALKTPLKKIASPRKSSSAAKKSARKASKTPSPKKSLSPGKALGTAKKTPGKSAKKTLKTPLKRSPSPGKTSPVSKKTPGKSAKKASLKTSPKKSPSPRRTSPTSKKTPGKSAKKATLKTSPMKSPSPRKTPPTSKKTPGKSAKKASLKTSPKKSPSPRKTSLTSKKTPGKSAKKATLKTPVKSPSPRKTPLTSQKTPAKEATLKTSPRKTPSPRRTPPTSLKTPGKSAKKATLKTSPMKTPSPRKTSPTLKKTPGKSAKEATLKTSPVKAPSPGKASSTSKMTPGTSPSKSPSPKRSVTPTKTPGKSAKRMKLQTPVPDRADTPRRTPGSYLKDPQVKTQTTAASPSPRKAPDRRSTTPKTSPVKAARKTPVGSGRKATPSRQSLKEKTPQRRGAKRKLSPAVYSAERAAKKLKVSGPIRLDKNKKAALLVLSKAGRSHKKGNIAPVLARQKIVKKAIRQSNKAKTAKIPVKKAATKRRSVAVLEEPKTPKVAASPRKSPMKASQSSPEKPQPAIPSPVVSVGGPDSTKPASPKKYTVNINSILQKMPSPALHVGVSRRISKRISSLNDVERPDYYELSPSVLGLTPRTVQVFKTPKPKNRRSSSLATPKTNPTTPIIKSASTSKKSARKSVSFSKLSEVTTFDFDSFETPNISQEHFVSPLEQEKSSGRRGRTARDLFGSPQVSVTTPTLKRKPGLKSPNLKGLSKLFGKSPKNDLRDVRGVKKIMRTPKPKAASPKNDLTNVAGVKRLLGSPKPKGKSPRNDLTNVAGVKKLLGSPKPKGRSPRDDLTDVRGVKRLLQSPPRSPKNDLTDVRGVRRLMSSPQKSPLNDLRYITGVKVLLGSPKPPQRSPKNDLRDVAGVRKLLGSPKSPQKSPRNDLRDVRGVRKLLSSPKPPQKSPKNDLRNVAGVKRLMASPRRSQKSPKNDLSDVQGVGELLATPGVPKNLSPVVSLKQVLLLSAGSDSVRGVRTLYRRKSPGDGLVGGDVANQLFGSPPSTSQASPAGRKRKVAEKPQSPEVAAGRRGTRRAATAAIKALQVTFSLPVVKSSKAGTSGQAAPSPSLPLKKRKIVVSEGAKEQPKATRGRSVRTAKPASKAVDSPSPVKTRGGRGKKAGGDAEVGTAGRGRTKAMEEEAKAAAPQQRGRKPAAKNAASPPAAKRGRSQVQKEQYKNQDKTVQKTVETPPKTRGRQASKSESPAKKARGRPPKEKAPRKSPVSKAPNKKAAAKATTPKSNPKRKQPSPVQARARSTRRQ